MNDYLSSIRALLETQGYIPMSGIVEGAHDHWYRHTSSTQSVNHVLYLSHKPMADAYAIKAGVFDSAAKSAVESKIPALSPYIETTILKWPAYIDSPCWHIFDAGRALQWGLLLVTPLPRDPGSWHKQIDSLFDDFLVPTFFPIQSAAEIMELLLRNDRPFEWFASSPVLRMAEIVALGRIAEVNPTLIRDRLSEFEEICSRRIPGKKFADALNAIFNELYS